MKTISNEERDGLRKRKNQKYSPECIVKTKSGFDYETAYENNIK